uniref:Uncharacterized protein n=1 Tax=Cannabis sativa TaxID=3483 RepID=A0A803QDC1_CANSA
MAGNKMKGDNNTRSFNVRTMNVPLLGNGTAPVNTINGGVGPTTVTPLNLFLETNGHVGETLTPAATVGKFLSITRAVVSEGIIQLTTTQYTTLQEQMQALQAEVNGREQRTGQEGLNLNQPTQREQVTRNAGRKVPQEEDPQRRNPRGRAQPQNEVNDAESYSLSSQSRSPSGYTTSSFVETPRGRRYRVHRERYAKEAKEKLLTNVNNLSERPEKFFKKECNDITFMESDIRLVHHPHANALVIVVNIGGDNVHQILVDSGSSVNLLNFQAFKQMGLEEKDLQPVTLSIYGFTGDTITLKGMIKLPITQGTAFVTAKSMADFIVIDQYSAYNAVIGRPILNEMKIITSIYHLRMKFPTPKGVGSVQGV